MYIPNLYHETDTAKLYALMAHYSFATVITNDVEGVPFATHMPVVLDTERGRYGTLISHMARANPQWQHFHSQREILIIFQGPHAYISPRWYTDNFNVPTWNYSAVHAYGVPHIVEDEARLQQMLDVLVAQYEAHQPNPWTVDWRDARSHHLLKGIVGFEMEIMRLEGKVKMNQNKSLADRRGVVAALYHSRDSGEAGVAAMMSLAITKEEEYRAESA